ncbi:MAG TPA: histidine phosphatase family protein, partial [Rhodanobacteraceae bacterium]|nr:histidine phosphatase family protein [Rhodanobacteraceae bacterium]
KQHGASPARVLCSPAARTRETCERVLAAIGYTDVRSDPRIYEATPGTLIRILDEHADANPLLLVGHNPGLETLVALLTEGASDSGRGIPPAGIVWLGVPAGSSIDPGTAAVHHFWWP